MSSRRLWFLPPAAIAAFSLLLNVGAFLVPHGKGDEVLFVGTALKLQKEGIGGYNLLHIRTKLSPQGLREFFLDPNSDGDFLADLRQRGVRYYDDPLFTTTPLLSCVIVASHAIFAGKDSPYYLFPWRGLDTFKLLKSVGIRRMARGLMQAQGYAVIPQVLANLGLLWAVYGIGVLLFDRRTGFTAAILTAACPILILCTHKIWADNLTALCFALAMLCYLTGRQRRLKRWAVAAGVCAGLAMLAKQTGLFIFPITAMIAAGEAILRLRRQDKRGAAEVLWFEAVFVLTAVAVGGGWYALVAWQYGDPLYTSIRSQPQAPGDWFEAMRQRPRWIHVVNLTAQSPMIALALLTWFDRGSGEEGLRRHRTKVLWCWYLTFVVLLWRTGELRYQLPALAPLVLLAAASGERLRAAAQKRLGVLAGNVLWAALLAAGTAYSCVVGLVHAWRGDPLILVPF